MLSSLESKGIRSARRKTEFRSRRDFLWKEIGTKIGRTGAQVKSRFYNMKGGGKLSESAADLEARVDAIKRKMDAAEAAVARAVEEGQKKVEALALEVVLAEEEWKAAVQQRQRNMRWLIFSETNILNVCLKGLYQPFYLAGCPRLTTQTSCFRTLGEAENLGSLLFLPFQSLISRNNHLHFHVKGRSLEHLTFAINKLWEYEFAVTLCEQYSCTTWLPSLVLALKKIGNNSLNEDKSLHLLVAMHFVANKLRDPENY